MKAKEKMNRAHNALSHIFDLAMESGDPGDPDAPFIAITKAHWAICRYSQVMTLAELAEFEHYLDCEEWDLSMEGTCVGFYEQCVRRFGQTIDEKYLQA